MPAPSHSLIEGYVVALTLAVVAIGLLGGLLMGVSAWQPVVVLTGLGIIGASLREREFGPHLGVSVATVILAAALPLVGPAGAAIVGYLSYLGDLHRQRLRTRLFNAAMTGCMGGVGGLAYLLVGGQAPLSADASPMELMARVALPLIVGYSVMTLLNAWLIGLMSRLARGGSALRAARRALSQVGVGYLTHALIAFLFVVLWVPVGVGIFAVVLIMVPLLAAQWTLSRGAAERRSHARTVKTLVAALEAANPYSLGHSARVAELCRRMAPRLRVDGPGAEGLHFAALLHDIGLVATTHAMPRVTGPVDLDYVVATSTHSEAGVRMLEDIDFLGEAMPGILHHHERVDGSGYPAGLRGDAIPLFARMIAVADAFDSLTTTRSYREALDQQQALVHLRSRVATHLDGAVVEALSEALAEQEWAPTVIEEQLRVTFGDAHDHDDPVVSDLYAQWSPDTEDAR